MMSETATYAASRISSAEREAAEARQLNAELLAALEGLSSFWEVALVGWDDLPFPDVFRKRVEAARAAIKKATA